MGKKDSGKKEETAQDRALAEVAAKKVARFRTTWAPQQRKAARAAEAMGAADSVERRQAKGAAITDADAAFQAAQMGADKAAAASGNVGSAGQKLGITSMGDDQATSVGLLSTQVDQNVDAASIAGIQDVVRLGQGKEALALGGLQSQANLASRVAADDAEASLSRDIGYASLAGQGLGLAAGAMSQPSTPALADRSSFRVDDPYRIPTYVGGGAGE